MPNLTHCPAHSAKTNKALEAAAVVQGFAMFMFDVCSAFPHADEDDGTYMRPPKEYVRSGIARSAVALWKLLKS